MKFLAFILLLLLELNPSYSQLSATDSLNMNMKCPPGISPEELHKKLAPTGTTDLEKIRAFYVWMAANINYDTGLFYSGKQDVELEKPAIVLKRRLAVCQGYADLFTELCRLSNISCYTVSGYNKFNNKLITAGHSWNIVWIQNKWQPVDVTWGAGVIDDNSKYVRSYSDVYFLQDPEDFLKEHYPLDPMWQLLEYPVTLTKYSNVNWKYSLNGNTIFHFNDTIAAWQKLERSEAELNSAYRMNRFNPGDKLSAELLAFALFNMGNRQFEKGTSMMEKLYGSKNRKEPVSEKERSEIIIALDSISIYFLNAEKYYKQVRLSRTADQQALKGNLEALRSNINVIRKQKERLK
jgi:hypothetical protein